MDSISSDVLIANVSPWLPLSSLLSLRRANRDLSVALRAPLIGRIVGRAVQILETGDATATPFRNLIGNRNKFNSSTTPAALLKVCFDLGELWQAQGDLRGAIIAFRGVRMGFQGQRVYMRTFSALTNIAGGCCGRIFTGVMEYGSGFHFLNSIYREVTCLCQLSEEITEMSEKVPLLKLACRLLSPYCAQKVISDEQFEKEIDDMLLEASERAKMEVLTLGKPNIPTKLQHGINMAAGFACLMLAYVWTDSKYRIALLDRAAVLYDHVQPPTGVTLYNLACVKAIKGCYEETENLLRRAMQHPDFPPPSHVQGDAMLADYFHWKNKNE